MQKLSDRIRRARRIGGVSQSELAASVGVTTSAVGHWERPGGPCPSTQHLIRIATFLSVRLEWLATGRGDVRLDGQIHEQGELSVALFCVEERQLLEGYRALPEHSRELLTRFLETLRV